MKPPSTSTAPERPFRPMLSPRASGLQHVSSLPRAAAPAGGSSRNTSGGLPPAPKPVNGEATRTSEKPEGSSAAHSAPAKPVNRPAASKTAIVYNAVQRRNPVTHAIKNVSTEVGDIVADFQVGAHNGVLFLSLKYHRLHPEYIHQRAEKMRNMYKLRILMVLCDISEHQSSLRELAKYAIINEFTMFVAWSNEEVAQYLTTFKSYEHKSADTLKERVHQTYHDQLQHVLTSGKKVNKTDADNLASQFGSIANISLQSSKVLSNVKGLGATKVTSLIDAFSKPFLVGGLKRPSSFSTVSAQATGSTAALMASTSIVTAALNGEARQSGRSNGKGKEKAVADQEEVGVVEAGGSPDWPSDAEEDSPPRAPSPPRARAPSRSPELNPELRPMLDDDGGKTGGGGGGAWRDPLDDEDGDEEERTSKRARLQG